MNNFPTNFNHFITQSGIGQGEALNYQFHPGFPSTSDVNYGFPPTEVKQTTCTEPWIDAWLINIGKNNRTLQVPLNKINATISSARRSLRVCLDILNKLTTISQDLQTNVQKLSSAEWKKKTIKIGHLKENFAKVINNLSNPESIAALQKSIHQRKKKRMNEKKKKILRQTHLKKEIEERRNIDKQIDRWLEVKKEEDNKVKTEETMNKDIDCVLAEVNRMKSDAKKNLSLIRALIKLRHVRETMYAQRGEKTSLEDKHAFATTSEKMLKIWENALKQYNTEEHMLKTMLEKTASENLKHKELLKEKETLFSWEKVIFGEKMSFSSENASLLALTAAERDMETFVAIRKSWDTFLVPPPLGSSLPIGWVLPPNECSKDWGKFLIH
ncbi:hypothetical protein HHI36_012525 [Cryptolaemus montrouzieri]|uniref:Programmed cell death protein 7 n=1 Tax=Cryptolaemus montrouzieri TaxID=559131 RepID=A0ABD2NFF6_9CUCU